MTKLIKYSIAFLFVFTFLGVNAQEMEIFQIVEQMPRFPGCEDQGNKREKEECAVRKLYEYINQNLKYPEEALKAKIEGKVIVRFAVTVDSKIFNIRVLRDIGGGCGEESIKVIKSMNEMKDKWIPGSQGGEKRNTWYTIPIVFKLDNQDKNEIFTEVEQMPYLASCKSKGTEAEKKKCTDIKMYQHIYDKLNYPHEARMKNVEGKVVVEFIITEEGIIDNIKIVLDIGAGCGKEVIKAVKHLNSLKWIAGKHDGKNVKVKKTIPINFKIN